MYVTCGEMFIITVALCVTLVQTCRNFKFAFVVWLLLLLILADVSTALLAVGLGLEGNKVH